MSRFIRFSIGDLFVLVATKEHEKHDPNQNDYQNSDSSYGNEKGLISFLLFQPGGLIRAASLATRKMIGGGS